MRDGKSCHFWFDNWTGKGRLIDITGATGTTYLGILRHASVSDAVSSDGWRIRGQRSRHFGDLYRSITAIAPPNPESGADIILWKHGDDNYQASFSASKTWEQLCVKKPKVAWSKVVWFSQGVPRYSFITWLAVKNRLSTGDRMRQWGLVQYCVEKEMRQEIIYFLHAHIRILSGKDLQAVYWEEEQIQIGNGLSTACNVWVRREWIQFLQSCYYRL